MEPKFCDKYGEDTPIHSPGRTGAPARRSAAVEVKEPGHSQSYRDPATPSTGRKRDASVIDSDEKPERSAGSKRQKQQEEVSRYFKKSTDVITIIAEEIKASNAFFRQ